MTLHKEEKLVIIASAIYTLAATMVTTFANVYLLQYTRSLIIMAVYSLVRYGTLGLSAFLAAKLSIKVKFSYPLLMGLVFITSAVVVLLNVKEGIADNVNLVYIVGAIWGFGEGFFWISVNTMIQVVTSLETRMRFLGLNGAFSNFMTIVAPILSSFILSLAAIEVEGYYMMFGLAIILFIITAVIASMIHASAVGKPFKVKDNLLSIKTDLQWRKVIVAQYIWGIKDAATISLTGLLIFMIVSDSSSYGRWLGLFAVIATLFQYASGYLLKPKNIMMVIILSGVGLFFSGMFLVFIPTMLGVVLYGIFHNVSTPFHANSFASIAMHIISAYMGKENIIGRTTSRELMTAAGRVTGFLIVIVLGVWLGPDLGVNVAFVCLYLGCLLFPTVIWYYENVRQVKTFDE